jgi:hypothetical protein
MGGKRPFSEWQVTGGQEAFHAANPFHPRFVLPGSGQFRLQNRNDEAQSMGSGGQRHISETHLG